MKRSKVFEVLTRVKPDLASRFGVVQLLLFGSTARDEAQPDSDVDIVDLQNNIDNWYRLWISLTGIEGMTNYIHLLGSGHITYYLKKYMNLRR